MVECRRFSNPIQILRFHQLPHPLLHEILEFLDTIFEFCEYATLQPVHNSPSQILFLVVLVRITARVVNETLDRTPHKPSIVGYNNNCAHPVIQRLA